MKKTRRKANKCLNCDSSLKKEFDYCPTCGQENNNNQVSFKSLVGDFFANYFSFDSRFGRSLKPFFLKPGQLTREFMEGKRVKYANPIRLYLIVSLVHFFFFSLNSDRSAEQDAGIIQVNNGSDKQSEIVPIDTTDTEDEEIGNDLNIGDDDWPITDQEWNIIDGMINSKNADYTVQEIEDSIRNQKNEWSSRYFKRQLIKVMKSDSVSVTHQIIKNIPLAMFFVLPILALFLKLLFRKRLYINHLIHTLHLHSFGYTVLTALWLASLFQTKIEELLVIISFLLISIYVVLSFRRTYQVKYVTAIAKSALTGFIYMFLLIAMLLIVVIVSLLLF